MENQVSLHAYCFPKMDLIKLLVLFKKCWITKNQIEIWNKNFFNVILFFFFFNFIIENINVYLRLNCSIKKWKPLKRISSSAWIFISRSWRVSRAWTSAKGLWSSQRKQRLACVLWVNMRSGDLEVAIVDKKKTIKE